MTSSGAGAAGFDARLRLISILFYAVDISMVLVIANTPLAQDDTEKLNRAALNLIAGVGVAITLTITIFPWHRYPRDTFFVIPTMGTLLITLCVFFSGGWDSFAYRLYVLPAVFYGLYFSPRLAALGTCAVVLAGASPQLYEPDLL